MRHKPDKENVPRKERKGGTAIKPCELVQKVLGCFIELLKLLLYIKAK